MTVRGLWPLRDLPAAVWLLAALVMTVVHPFVPESRWLMVHLLLLGALTHAVVVWSEHFTWTLLRIGTTEGSRRSANRRFGLLASGVVLVVAGMPTGWWWAVLAGAIVVGAAVAWHGAVLVGAMRRALPTRFRPLVRYYVASAACLPVGAGLGAWSARAPGGDWPGRILVAHSATNLLGWVGLVVAGTVVTFWPTILRTRMAPTADADARRALPVLLAGLGLAVGAALAGLILPAALGVGVYLAGWAILGRGLVLAVRQRAPRGFAGLSVGAALAWLPATLVAVIAALAGAAGHAAPWAQVAVSYGTVTTMATVGFASQLLLGALSFLIPSVLGGGPSAVRAATAAVDKAAGARVAIVNVGLIVCLVPVPSLVRVIVSVLVVLALAAALPLLARSIRASRRVRRDGETVAVEEEDGPRAQRNLGHAVAGLAAVGLAVTLGVGLDPAAAGIPAPGAAVAAAGQGPAGSGGAAETGRTTTVRVEAVDMRFVPDRIEVPAGDRLQIELVNTDPTNVHDLVLANGANSGRVAPHATATMDAGVIGGDVDGWCSVAGHRQMGMVLRVVATGAGVAEQGVAGQGGAAQGDARAGGMAGHDMGGHQGGSAGSPDRGAAADLDFARKPSEGFTPYDAVLPPLTDEKVRKATFTVEEVEREVAPGVRQKRWTFNGTVPGPTLHGRVGDVFEITLVNHGSMGHSIDFHASEVSPERLMRTIPPGESLVYRFTANRSGIWMYHCSTMPMTSHIAAGMFGAVIIEPPDLPTVDRSYVLVQSEAYLAGQGEEVNADKVLAERPDAVVFNGVANQYDHAPLPARVGERVRFWVLAAGPNRGTSFHIVGAQFDTSYAEGAYTLFRGRGALSPSGAAGGSAAGGTGSAGAQALGLHAAQGGFVETVFAEPGRYPMVNHVMVDAERGAHGFVEVK